MEQIPYESNTEQDEQAVVVPENAASETVTRAELTPEQQQAVDALEIEIAELKAKIDELDAQVDEVMADLEPLKEEIRNDLLDLENLEIHGTIGISGRYSEKTALEIKALKNRIFIKLSGLRAKQKETDESVHPLRAERFRLAGTIATKRRQIEEITGQPQ